MGIITAVCNQKGGVAKTTSVFNIGACLSLKHDKKVLLIDIDPQANLSEYLGYEANGKPTLTNLIMTASINGAVSANEVRNAVRYSEKANVDYIPADLNLASFETIMASAISRETILRRIISDDIKNSYDFIIIDCLPSLSTLLLNALSSSDKVLIPVQTHKFSLDGLQALENLFTQIKNTLNPNAEIMGVLPTLTDRTLISRNAVESLKNKYDALLFNTHISKSVDGAKSSETGIPLCVMGGKLGNEYESLTQEVLERCMQK